MQSRAEKLAGRVLLLVLFLLLPVLTAEAQPFVPSPPPSPVSPLGQGLLTPGGIAGLASPGQVSVGLQILALLTILSLAPAILMMLTSFVRIVVVLGFVRRAMGTQEVPPNQVILGLALFLTFFVMAPTFERVNSEALQPYLAGQLTPREAYDATMHPVREFLFAHCRKTDLALFVRLGHVDKPRGKDDIPSHVLIPAFLISELKTAFTIGFLIYVPFLIIDMVIASILLSMGMMMLPPIIISLPFKVLLFVLVDGWNLVVGSLMRSF
ncbi:flagellar type III secretion system pore protein FliP [Candidatus Sumerlaeota bacterium]|nr:flagellar type III secretion system pore protein FliP [Candidatus Sumerlaeota bacterium]